MKRHLLISIFVVPILLYSCKKEPTTWDTDWAAPIAYGHLTINDMMPVDYVETNSEGYLSLVIHESVFQFSLDTLIKLPDTTITVKTAIGIPSIDVSPAFSLPDNYDQVYDLGEIELKRVIIQSGLAEATILSPWQGKTKITFNFPNVTNPGGVLQRIYYLDAGTIADPTSVYDEINMALQDLDLRGIDGTLYNTLGINILIESNEESSNFLVTNTDSIAFSFKFQDLMPRYAKGYFGQYTFSDTTGVSLPPLKQVVAGSIDLDSIDMTLTIKNGFNIIAQAKVSKMTGINTRTSNLVDLDFAEKGTTLNINPASGGLYDYVPSEYPLTLNNFNSNILSFIENLSDSIILGYQLKINPFGNTTAGSDEFFPDSKMELFLDGEFPLQFGANNLTIVDTFLIDAFETSTISPREALVFIDYTNGFPIAGDLVLYLLDQDDQVLDSIVASAPILAGSFQAATYATLPHAGSVQFELTTANLDHLETTDKIVLKLKFNSDANASVKITPETFFDFKLRTNLQIRVTL